VSDAKSVLLVEEITTKLGESDYHVSGHCWKRFSRS